MPSGKIRGFIMIKRAIAVQTLISSQHYLFIGHPRNAIVQHLHSALNNHENLSLTMRPDSKLLDVSIQYAAYVLDADYLSDVQSLIRSIRHRNPQARILVIARNPGWEAVRDAFRAGAIDMIASPTSCTATRLVLDHIIESALPGDCKA
jgi:DNA-binding NarL/FixJ family response regulator